MGLRMAVPLVALAGVGAIGYGLVRQTGMRSRVPITTAAPIAPMPMETSIPIRTVETPVATTTAAPIGTAGRVGPTLRQRLGLLMRYPKRTGIFDVISSAKNRVMY